jgi:hypothetical protein
MDNNVNIFGKSGPASVADSIMNSDVLNAAPSPASPQTAPSDDLAKSYYRLLYSIYAIQKIEVDPEKLTQLKTMETFIDTECSRLALKKDEFSEIAPPTPPPVSSAAPAPTPPPVGPPPMAGPPKPPGPPGGMPPGMMTPPPGPPPQ